MEEKVKILIPVYNDWAALSLLIEKIREHCGSFFSQLSFVVVDDCSSSDPDPQLSFSGDIEVVHLNRNVGHQKAIAIGLAYLSTQKNYSKVIVMDSDGEDRPEDISKLVKHSESHARKIIFAKRTKRHEGVQFQFFYKIYKAVFQLLTGREINFGNFCLIPRELLAKLVYVSEIWNHFSGGVIRSKLPYATLPLERGKRLAGESKMNFTSLVLHGLSAVSVHIDVVSVRLLIFFIGLIVIACGGIGAVMVIKCFTALAIPGWATYAVLGFSILMMQALLISLLLAFMVLNHRTHKHFIPAIDYKDYIQKVEKIHHNEFTALHR